VCGEPCNLLHVLPSVSNPPPNYLITCDVILSPYTGLGLLANKFT
jgi:hypothetical protein